MASAAAMVPGRRAPDRGSASTGQCSRSAKAPTSVGSGGVGVSPPATMMPSPRSGTRSGPGPAPPGRRGDDRPWSVRKGIRRARQRLPEGQIEVHGPGARAVRGSPRRMHGRRVGARRAHGLPWVRPGLDDQRTAVVKSPTWSMVWGAPVSSSSGGRSAVQTIRGTRPWCASTTAGVQFRRRGAAGDADDGRAPGGQGQPQGEEPGAALVETDVMLQAGGERERQRCRP